MKIKPQIYAEALIGALKEANCKTVARSFWYSLQKNGQYKDLKKILETLDQKEAEQQDKILVQAYSSRKLSPEDIQSITKKITTKLHKEPIIKEIIKPGLTGIIVKTPDYQIDLTAEGQIDRLKLKLNSTSK